MLNLFDQHKNTKNNITVSKSNIGFTGFMLIQYTISNYSYELK